MRRPGTLIAAAGEPCIGVRELVAGPWRTRERPNSSGSELSARCTSSCGARLPQCGYSVDSPSVELEYPRAMQADGSHPRNITDKANADEYEPSWSPSGIASARTAAVATRSTSRTRTGRRADADE